LKRVKRRYLALQIDFDGALGEREFLDTVWAAITRLYGEYGASRTDLRLLHFDEAKKIALIRVSLAALDQVRAALVSVIKISDKDAAVHVKTVSGTIKSIREKR
jgi:RNase P/RNase MRP subunit POP5